MRDSKIPKLLKLEDEPIWQEACSLAEVVYSKLHEIPSEEKWETERKLRSSANDLMFYVSQALGNASPNGREYDWGNARKYASSLKTMYRFAGRQKFIVLDPKVMVRIDKLIAQIEARVVGSYKETEQLNEEELELWRQKVRTHQLVQPLHWLPRAA